MCDTLVSFTADGLLFAKNSDRDPNEPQTMRWYSPADHHQGAEVKVTWSSIAQVLHTRAVLISQPWWMWGAEMGVNDAGVVIGNEAVFNRPSAARRPDKARPDVARPDHDSELLGMDLVRLALERAGSAHEAVGVITELFERHGQGGPCSAERPRFRYDNSFLIADPDGAYVLETAGRQWAAQEVSGPGYAISNGLTIPGFAERHADPLRTRIVGCRRRRRRATASAQHAATSSTPVSDLLMSLRDHGSAGPAPRYSRMNGALSAPCAHAGGILAATQTTGSWLTDLRGSAPAGRHWVSGTAAPCLSLFRPVPFGPQPRLEPEHGVLANRYDDSSLWWRHERLHRLAVRDYPAALGRFGNERDQLEAAWIDMAGGDALPVGEADQQTRRLADLAEVAAVDADAAYQRWAHDVAGAQLYDRRPRALQQRWDRWNRAARMLPEAGPPGQRAPRGSQWAVA